MRTQSFAIAAFSLSVFASCGEVQTAADDAGSPIDAGDSPVVDAAAQPQPDAQAIGTVTVSVFAGGLAAEGVIVFTNAANGDYLTSGITNANGIVKFESFPTGGTVTAAARAFGDFSTSDSKMLSSVTSVAVGETITFGRSKIRGSSGNGLDQIGSLEVTVPGPFADAALYSRTVACDASSGPNPGTNMTNVGNMTIYDGCIFPDGTMDVLAYALDSTLIERIAYSFGTGVNLGGPQGNISGSVVLPDWQTDLGSYAAELTNSPQDDLLAGVSFVGLNRGLPLRFGDLPPVQLQEGGSATLNVGIAPGFHDESVFSVQALPGTPPQNSSSFVVFREDGGPTALGTITKTINLTTELAGLINNLVVSDTSPLEVSWDNASLACKENPEPDGLIVAVTGETKSDTYEWVMLTPGTTPSGIALPSIDPALAVTLWPENSFTQVEAGLVFKGNSRQNYAELRTKNYNLSTGDSIPYLANSVQCLATAGTLPR